MKKTLFVTLAFCAVNVQGQQVFNKNQPLANTFSIVARDSITGELAVGVQSHWFSVGTAVPWAEAGVGAVATQSFVDFFLYKLADNCFCNKSIKPLLSLNQYLYNLY